MRHTVLRPKFYISQLHQNTLSLKDAIDERLIKARAIVNCLLSQDNGYHALKYNALHGAVWAIDDYLDEIEYLEGKIKE